MGIEEVQRQLQLLRTMAGGQVPGLVWREQDQLYSQRYALTIFHSLLSSHPLFLSTFYYRPDPPSASPVLTNRSSSTDTLKQNPLTDDKNVAAIQGGVAEGVGGQFSSGGLLGGVGDMSSKEGMNRFERGEMDPRKLEEIKKKEQNQKGWTETLSGGYLGGSGEKK